MSPLSIFILLILLTQTGYGQTFINAYKKYKIERIDTISNLKTRKRMKSLTRSQIVELDTIFQYYKSKNNFDFNTADTLFIIFNSPVQSPFTNDIIIWSGKDTISYKQGFETNKHFKNKRIITYGPFTSKVNRPNGFKVVTERDSIVTLVSKRDFNTINHLGDNQNISDGSYISIYVAYKVDGRYKFETCFPKQFVIQDVYRKE